MISLVTGEACTSSIVSLEMDKVFMTNDNGSVNPHTSTSNNQSQVQPAIDPILLRSLEWRCIGPYRGGRVVAVAADPAHAQVFYFGSTGGGIWKTTDGGIIWENVSDGFFKRASVGALAVSPSDPNVIYVGMGESTIRGNVSHGDGVYRSTDAGKSWTHLGLADTRNIAKVRIHPRNPDLLYVAALGHAHGPNAERGVFRTMNGGKSWERILFRSEKTGAIDLSMDPNNPRILYAGTETGIHVSFDDGAHWQSLRLNLPVVPIHDLVIKDGDLVVATHGRSFWILDDITPLRQASEDVQQLPVYLFKPRATVRFMVNYGYSRPAQSGNFFRDSDNTQIVARREMRPGNIALERTLNAGQNPPNGMIVYYTLASKPEGEVKLTFLDMQGNELKTFAGETERKPAADPIDEEEEQEKKEPDAPKEAGLNRFIWNMRYPDPKKVDGYVSSDGAMSGPVVVPGTYQVRLTVGDQSLVETFEVQKDPRVSATQADLEAQLALHLKIRDKLSETHDAINTLRNVRQQIDDWQKRAQDQPVHEALTRVGKSAREKLKAIEDELIQSKAKTRQDTLNHPAKLNGKLAGLAGVVASAQAAPTKQSYVVFDDLSQRIDAQLQQLQEVLDTDVASFNSLLREHNVPGVIPIATLNNKNGK
ncbi:MAG: hypothetical protein NVS3B14_16060 [Ktedonobacteraceae bacterium]